MVLCAWSWSTSAEGRRGKIRACFVSCVPTTTQSEIDVKTRFTRSRPVSPLGVCRGPSIRFTGPDSVGGGGGGGGGA